MAGIVAPTLLRSDKPRPIAPRHPHPMPMRRGPLTRGTDRGLELVFSLMREAEKARAASGTSYAEIGRALNLAEGQVARILRCKVASVTIVRAAQILAAVGMKLSAGAFPEGSAVRETGQRAV